MPVYLLGYGVYLLCYGVYLLCYGYVLLHVVLLGCRFFECLCCFPMDHAFEPVERAMYLNVAITSSSRRGRDIEHVPYLVF